MNSENLSDEMCKTWKFNDYCRNLPNSSNDNVTSFKSNNSQNIPKSNKGYYNDEHISLLAEIAMNHHTVEVNITFSYTKYLCIVLYSTNY